ncbi:MAG: ATP-binding protein [Polyangiaceae bacterium]|nr:ATP-binding protein [Polyangiaceae bacterium]
MPVRSRIFLGAVQALARRSPALVILGARQAGKSTLARLAFPDHARFDLEDPRDAERLADDPLFALSEHRHVVLDEVQRLPELFPVLRVWLDADPRRRVVLLGSASPGLLRRVSESLTGRALFFDMPGLSVFEEDAAKLWRLGGFPRLHWSRPRARPEEWYPAYLRTTLERDVPQLGLPLSAARARTLLTLLAHAQGSTLNLSELGQPLGVSYHTVAAALDVLEGVFLVRRLPPFIANLKKRLVKSPKIYLRDTGLLHSLLGLGWTRARQLAHPKVGASWETFCLEQLVAHARLADPGAQAFFYRTQTGVELDLVLVVGGEPVGLEMKLGLTPKAIGPATVAMADLGLRRYYQVNASDGLVPLRPGMWAGGLVPVLDALGLRPKAREPGARSAQLAPAPRRHRGS